LPPDDRKEVLKQIALHAIDKPVTAGQKIAAIRELNLMEGSYAPVRYQHQHVVFEVITVDYTQRQFTEEEGDDAIQREREAEGLLEGQKEGTEDVHPDPE